MYTKAIVRRPGRNFAEGITTANLGKPDFEKALEQHSAYCYALTAWVWRLLSWKLMRDIRMDVLWKILQLSPVR